MHAGKLLLFAALGLLLTGCTGVHTVPTPEARQSLAPSDSLRVGLYRGGPASVIPGATPNETKGVGYDLGRELARRLGVAFEPVIYPSPGALIDGGKSGEWDVSFVAVASLRRRRVPVLFR